MKTNHVKRHKKISSDKVLYWGVAAFLTLMAVIALYPIIYVVSASFSSTKAVMAGKVFLLPVDFSLDGYKAVFRTNKVLIGYRNSAFYTVAGTAINLVMTVMAAYPLSRKDMPGRGIFMKLFAFTMLFGGGMIPNYLLIKDLGMMNTIWAMLIPGAISVYNTIVVRTFFNNSVPGELLEASKMDGCGDTRYLLSVALPLSKSVIAVITLWYAVGHWNSYFNAFMYLSDQNLYPLQIFLREILIASKVDAEMLIDEFSKDAPPVGLEYILKYSLIVVSTVPMLVIYPFVQKHFVKGVMIGAVKG